MKGKGGKYRRNQADGIKEASVPKKRLRNHLVTRPNGVPRSKGWKRERKEKNMC